MFSKPEEVIMACLAVLWVVMTYVVVRFTGDWGTVLTVTGSTALWAAVSFVLWQVGRADKLYPLLLGGLVACWWAILDWFALRGINAPSNNMMLLQKPWYASWWLKFILAAIPVVLGYVKMWKRSQKPKF